MTENVIVGPDGVVNIVLRRPDGFGDQVLIEIIEPAAMLAAGARGSFDLLVLEQMAEWLRHFGGGLLVENYRDREAYAKALARRGFHIVKDGDAWAAVAPLTEKHKRKD